MTIIETAKITTPRVCEITIGKFNRFEQEGI